MEVNRALQREILEGASKRFPAPFSPCDLSCLLGVDPTLATQQFFYLSEHGLLELKTPKTQGITPVPHIVSIKATAKGIDFIADDGGLSAVLGVVTIKLHEDSLKALIEKRIEDADLSGIEKKSLLASLKGLPGEAMKHLTLKLLDAGLRHGPDALHLLRTTLGSHI